jgi:HlyD family secretion protein
LTRRKIVVLSVAAVAVLGAVGAAIALRGRHAGTPVRTVKVGRRDLTSVVTANGTVQARTKVDLSANIMGQITELSVEEGDAVRKGQRLLVIDQARYAAVVDSRRYALGALEAELTRVREAAAQAARDHARAERQFRDEILPAAEYDRIRSLAHQTEAQARVAERQISQARADLHAAEDELRKTEITAPIDGVVTRRNVERGEVVVTGTMNNPGTVLMTISDMSSVEAVLEVDQTDVPLLTIGQSARVLIDAFPDTPFPGSVSEIGSSPIQGASLLGGAATGTDYEVKVALLKHPPLVRPGLTVTADITTASRKGVLAVPIGALVLREPGEAGKAPARVPEEGDAPAATAGTGPESVASRERDVEGLYLVEGGKVVFRPVVTGIKGELDLEIVSGLKEGEEVVVGPFQALRELHPGDPVEVDDREGRERPM